MRKTSIVLGLFAAAAGGCAKNTPMPPVVYNPADIIASGRPPLVFIISRPGALNVFDMTTQSRVVHVDVSPSMASSPTTLKLDGERRALVAENTGATQPADKWETVLPIDPTHQFAVEFQPDFRPTAPATMPGGEK